MTLNLKRSLLQSEIEDSKTLQVVKAKIQKMGSIRLHRHARAQTHTHTHTHTHTEGIILILFYNLFIF